MKSKPRKFLIWITVLTLAAVSLPACGGNGGKEGTTLETMAPVDDVWKNPLPTAGTTKAPPTAAKQDKIIRDALGKDVKWDGDFKKLTDEQKQQIKDAFKDEGFIVDVTDDGVKIKDGNTGVTVTEVYETQKPVPVKTKLSGITPGFIKTFGSTGNDMFARVKATADGGFAAVGLYAAANGDCAEADEGWIGTKSMIVKYNAKGEVEWKSFLGGDNSVTFASFTQLADGSFIAAGQTQSSDLGVKEGRKIEMLLVKYNAKGEKQWHKVVGGTKYEYFSSVTATPDGGFIAGGKAESSDGDFEGLKDNMIKAVLIKYDADGNVRWKRAMGGSKHNDVEGLAVNAAGDIFAAYVTNSDDGDFASIAGRGEADTVIVKYDKNGTFQWVNSFSGSGDDEMTFVAPSPDGGCVIGGRFNIDAKSDGSFDPYHNAGGYDGFLVKYNKNGTIGWVKSIAGFLNDRISGIEPITGGYAVVGATESKNRDFAAIGNKGEQDGFLALISEQGELMVMRSVSGSADDLPRAAASRDGKTIFVAGGTKSNDFDFKGLNKNYDGTSYECFAAVFTAVSSPVT